jgi:hypothetical protein
MALDSKIQKAAAEAYAAIQTPSADKAKALASTAADAIMSSADVRNAISDETKALLNGVASGAFTVLAAVDIKKLAAAAKLSPSAFASQAATQGVGLVLSMAPNIATALGATTAATSLMGVGAAAVAAAIAVMNVIAAPLNAELAAQATARAERYYEGLKLLDDTARTRMRPRPTGPRGENRPADLFPYQSWKGIGPVFGMSKCADTLYRPLIGAALMRLTESGLDKAPVRKDSGIGEEPEWDPERPASCAVLSGMISAAYYPMWIAAIRNKNKNQALGIPEDRRRIFRMIRQAIQAQWNVPGTDGGAYLWPAYMDLLVREFDEGHLTPGSIGDFMAGHVDWDYNEPGKKSISFTSQTTGWQVAAAAINTLVDQWRSTVNPIYAQDVASRNAANKLFVALSRLAALKTTGSQYVPPALLKDIPPELVKQIGVAVRPKFTSAADDQRMAELKAQGLTAEEATRQLQRERAAQGTSPVVGAAVVVAAGIGITLLYRAMTSPAKTAKEDRA